MAGLQQPETWIMHGTSSSIIFSYSGNHDLSVIGGELK